MLHGPLYLFFVISASNIIYYKNIHDLRLSPWRVSRIFPIL